MKQLRQAFRRVRALFQKEKLDQELDEEVRFHVQQQTEVNMQAGMNPEEARYAALRQFGWVESIKEKCRDQRGARWIEDLQSDVWFALRTMSKNRGFTAIAMVTLALGIGANTGIFSVVYTVLLKPLPFENAGSLVWLREVDVPKDYASHVSPALFLDLRQQAKSYVDVAAMMYASYDLIGKDFAESIQGLRMSASSFPLLRIKPLLGRAILPEDEKPGQEKVVLMSHGLWLRRFGGDTNLIGKTITLNDAPHTVVGIMPPHMRFFSFAGRCDLWQPYVPEEQYLNGEYKRQFRHLWVIGALRREINRIQAQAEASAFAMQFERSDPKVCTGWTIKLVPVRSLYFGPELQKSLLVLLGAVGLVLFIVCANVANLLLARASTRRREVTVRVALGASRGRLVRQFLTESVVLALTGALLGIIIMWWTISLVKPLMPPTLPGGTNIDVDVALLLISSSLALLTGIGIGLLPACQSSRPHLAETLKEGGGQTIRGGGRSFIGNLLISSEVALTMVLLVGAGLLVHSVMRMLRVDLGFDPTRLMSTTVKLSWNRYQESARRQDFYLQALKRIKVLPGVESTAASFGGLGSSFAVEGRPEPVMLGIIECTGGPYDYLRAMRIPLLQGRYFSDDDLRGDTTVILVTELTARRLWPGEHPIGKRIRQDSKDSSGKTVELPWLIVIGVVKDTKQWIASSDPYMCFYVPLGRLSGLAPFQVDFVVRTFTDPLVLAKLIRAEVESLDRSLPVREFTTFESQLAETRAGPRLYMTLLTVFAMIALVLAIVGLYGVLSYFVVQRTREIGLRMALGATRRMVLWTVVKQGLVWTSVGLALGLAATLGLTRFISSQLYNVKPTDPATFVIVALLLACMAFVACLIPALQATKIDPMTALRYE